MQTEIPRNPNPRVNGQCRKRGEPRFRHYLFTLGLGFLSALLDSVFQYCRQPLHVHVHVLYNCSHGLETLPIFPMHRYIRYCYNMLVSYDLRMIRTICNCMTIQTCHLNPFHEG